MQDDIPDNAVFAAPWTPVADATEADRLTSEFLVEAPYLANAVPKAVAVRLDNNNVLFHFQATREVRQGGFPFGVVQLTWSGAEEPKIGQRIQFFECWSHWEFEGMKRDVAGSVKRSGGAA